MYVFQEGNVTQEGVKEESVKWKKLQSAMASNEIAGKQEAKAMKCSICSQITQCSENQPVCLRVSSICKTDKKYRCHCHIVFLIDGFFYLNHMTTNLIHTGHPECTPGANLKGIKYIHNPSKWLIEHMPAFGVSP